MTAPPDLTQGHVGPEEQPEGDCSPSATPDEAAHAVNHASLQPRATRDLILRFYEQLWNQWDDSAVEEVLAEHFRFRGSLGTETFGRDGWRQYRDSIRAGAPDFHNHVIQLVIDGASGAARLLYTGTHLGPLADISATGRRFSYSGAAFFTSAAQRLESAWVLGDLPDLKSQLDRTDQRQQKYAEEAIAEP